MVLVICNMTDCLFHNGRDECKRALTEISAATGVPMCASYEYKGRVELRGEEEVCGEENIVSEVRNEGLLEMPYNGPYTIADLRSNAMLERGGEGDA